jgi:plastocyanin
VNVSRVHFPWILRSLLVIGIVVVLVAALGGRPAANEAVVQATPSAQPTPSAETVPLARDPIGVPTVDPTALPTASREVFVERIVSRLSRETQVPYPTSTPGPENQGFVSVVDFAYMPSVLRIKVGQTVVWRNDGVELHDITGQDDWHSGAMEPYVEYRRAFGFVGTFRYQCSVHLDMRGTIIVDP